MKYIDSEKLLAEIDSMLSACTKQTHTGVFNTCTHFKGLITSLQQEQPEVDLVAELKHHLATTPKEQLEKEWKELEPWGNIGPTVQEFLYGKQLEADLEKAARNVYESWNGGTMDDVRRDMVELGKVLNARKEE